MKKVIDYFKGNPIVVMLTIVSIIVGFTTKNFFSWSNFGNLMSNTAVRFIIALGVSGCLITKGTDLSAGRQVGLAACLSGILVQRAEYTGRLFPNLPEFNMFVALIIVVIVGALFGAMNGLIISRLKVPPFITTLGTQTIVYGLCLVLTNAQPIGGFRDTYIKIITGRIGSVKGLICSLLQQRSVCSSGYCTTKHAMANTCMRSAEMKLLQKFPVSTQRKQLCSFI